MIASLRVRIAVATIAACLVSACPLSRTPTPAVIAGKALVQTTQLAQLQDSFLIQNFDRFIADPTGQVFAVPGVVVNLRNNQSVAVATKLLDANWPLTAHTDDDTKLSTAIDLVTGSHYTLTMEFDGPHPCCPGGFTLTISPQKDQLLLVRTQFGEQATQIDAFRPNDVSPLWQLTWGTEPLHTRQIFSETVAIGNSGMIVLRAVEKNKRSSLMGLDARDGHIAWTVDTGVDVAIWEGAILTLDDDARFVAIFNEASKGSDAVRIEFRSTATGKLTRDPIRMRALGMLRSSDSSNEVDYSIGIIGDEIWVRYRRPDRGPDDILGGPTCLAAYFVFNIKTGRPRNASYLNLDASPEWRDAISDCRYQMMMQPIRGGILAVKPEGRSALRVIRFSRPP
jgi:hypothetical protein